MEISVQADRVDVTWFPSPPPKLSGEEALAYKEASTQMLAVLAEMTGVYLISVES